MKPPSIFSPALAVGDRSRRLGYLLLLLAYINCCSSQKVLISRVGKIADSLQTLTDSVKAQERTSEKLASSLTKILSFMVSDYLPCEEGWLKLGTSCYFISEDTSSWQESREKCIAMDADYAKVTTDEEFNFLLNLVKDDNTWVGLNDLEVEGTFVWTDGTVHPMIESWWGGVEPNNAGQGGQHCVHFWVTMDGLWADSSCDLEYRYICEKSLDRIQD